MDQGIRNLTRELSALAKMNMQDLRAKYREAFGEETTSHNAAYLRKKIAWRLQELTHGGLTERAQARLAEIQRSAPIRERPRADAAPRVAAATAVDIARVARAARDPGLPPVGSVLRRVYQGTTHEVTVADDGFVYRGKTHASLSSIARAITGTTWNGRLFFGLVSRKRKEAA